MAGRDDSEPLLTVPDSPTLSAGSLDGGAEASSAVAEELRGDLSDFFLCGDFSPFLSFLPLADFFVFPTGAVPSGIARTGNFGRFGCFSGLSFDFSFSLSLSFFFFGGDVIPSDCDRLQKECVRCFFCFLFFFFVFFFFWVKSVWEKRELCRAIRTDFWMLSIRKR